MHDGSALVVRGCPDDLWAARQNNGDLIVDLLGGGTATLPSGEVYEMALWRRPRPVSAAPGESDAVPAATTRAATAGLAMTGSAHV